MGQTHAPPPRPRGQTAIYSPLRLGRWAQLLGPWERSGRDSRRVPRPAWVSQGGRAGQEPGSRPACPPRGRPGPASLWALSGRPQLPARRGCGRRAVVPPLSPRWVRGGPEERGVLDLWLRLQSGKRRGPEGLSSQNQPRGFLPGSRLHRPCQEQVTSLPTPTPSPRCSHLQA